MVRVCDWLAGSTDSALPGGRILWDRYQRFKSELIERCREARQEPERLTFVEYVRYVDEFRSSKDDVLIIAGDRKIKNPTAAQIRNTLASLPDTDPFAIYAKSGSGLTYMQTSGSPKDGYLLEYQAGSVEEQFSSTNSALSLEETVQAFVWYSTGDGGPRCLGNRWSCEC